MFSRTASSDTHGWGAWPSRCRFSPYVRGLLTLSLSTVLGCGSEGHEFAPKHEHTLVQIDGERLDESVVRHLMERDGIDRATAVDQAVASLRLVAAARARQKPGDPPLVDAGRAEHLRRAASVRLWLEERFEGSNRVEAIPDSFIKPALDSPQVMRRYFHPQYHLVCQLLVQPGPEFMEESDDGRSMPKFDILADSEWQAGARKFIEPIAEQWLNLPQSAVASEDCEMVFEIARLAKRSSDDGRYKLKKEQIVMELGATERWDPDFLKAVGRPEAPSVIEPFVTQFGLHLVANTRIMPERHPADSASEAELLRLRTAFLRNELHAPWLAKAYAEKIGRLRAELGVQLAAGVADQK